MADDLDIELGQLAPAVDTERAGAAFRRRRRRAVAYRTGALAAAAAAVLVAGTVAVIAAGDEDHVDTAPAGPIASVVFEVLAVVPATDDMGTLRAATDAAAYADLWEAAGGGDRPAIGLEQQAVVSITIPDDACPPELARFDRSGDEITPVFVEPGGGCDEPLIPKTYLVAIDWGPLGDSFTLHLPADEVFGYGEQRLQVERGTDPSMGGAPTCGQVEHFAEQITETGIVYDYEPSDSPEELMAGADAVFAAILTGETATHDSGDDRGMLAVGFEVEVTDSYRNPRAQDLAGDVQYVWLDVGRTELFEPLQEAAVHGIPVVIFAYETDRGPGYSVGVEGFITGCPGGPIIGRIGTQGAWQAITDLDTLMARLGTSPDDHP